MALWTPVAFGAGAASYFGLKTEPPLWIGLAAAGLMRGSDSRHRPSRWRNSSRVLAVAMPR